jgi:5-dehydro-2-deoxygluconokinase
LSDFLLEFLAQENVDTGYVQRRNGYLPSLAITEISPPDSFPQVFYRNNPADTQVELGDPELDYLASAKMFITNGTSLCASPSRESTYRALERAHQAGSRVVLDVDYRSMSWKSSDDAGLAIRLALPFVDVLIGNDVELKLVAGTSDLDEAVRQMRSRVPMLVSKLGSQGTRVWVGDDAEFLPPYKIQVVSTIGAGDGFASGFLYGLGKDLPLRDCLHYGNAAAALVVGSQSCSEAMPTLAEVQRMLEEQRPAARTSREA